MLIPAIVCPMVGLWIVSALGAQALHQMTYPSQALSNSEGLGAILVAVSPFLGAVPTGMIIGNFLMNAISGARKAFNREAAEYPGTDYWSAQKGLFLLALVLVPFSASLTILGALMSWSLRS